jgi:hypothetical protein
MGDGVGEDDLEHERYRDAAVTAAGRVFRLYENHCATPDLDTLHHLLNALHSLNDRLEKAVGRDLHEIDEFIAIKVLRNFAHHQEDVSANVRVVPTPAQSDLMTMCLVRQDQVDRAIENVRSKWQAVSRAACEKHFHWYGDAVNINPCLFNLVVRIYEDMITFDLAPPDEDVRNLATSYAFEEEHGYSHYVDGTLSAHAGDVNEVLSKVVAELPAA